MDKRILTVATVVIAIVALCVCLPSNSEAVTTADDLQSAVSSSSDGTETTIELENDIVLSQTLSIPAGKVIVLDLAGSTLSIESGFAIEVNGDLTINDSKGNGAVSTGAGVTVITRSGSDLTINGGTYTTNGLVNSYSRALEVQGSATITAGSFITTALIAAGTNYTNAISVGNSEGANPARIVIDPEEDSDVVVSSTNDYALTVRYGAEALISGGTFTGSSNYQDLYNLDFPEGGSISVTGGNFSGVVQSEYIADGYTCVPQGDRFIVLESGMTSEVTVNSYDGLADALEGDLSTTDVITIGSDITIPAGAELVLDFPDSLTVQNGATLTVLGILTVNGYLYVDGTLTVSDRGFIENPLNVTINEGSITGFPEGESFTVMTPMDLQWLSLANEIDAIPSYIELGTDIDLSGYMYTSIGREGKEVSSIEFNGNGYTISNMTQDTGSQDAGLFGDIFDSVISDVTIKGSSLRTSSGYGGFLAAMIGGNTTVTSVQIEGCKLNTTGSYGNGGFTGGVWCIGDERLEFIDCEISGSIINGYANTGGFWGTSSRNTGSIGIYNTSMSETTVSSSSVNAGVLGGFGDTARVEAIGVDMNGITVIVNGSAQKPPLLVSPSSSDAYVDDDDIDSTAVKNGEGDWEAMGDDESIVAINGGAPYASLNAAVADADSGDVIALVNDVTEDVVIPAGSDITLDLGTFTITNVSGDTITVQAGAALRIVGDGTVDNLTHQRAAVHNYGTVTIEGGSFTRSAEVPVMNAGESSSNTWYLVVNEGTMTINGGDFRTGTGETYGNISSLIRNGTDTGGDATLTISDGTFTTAANVVKNEPDGTITAITGGVFTMDNTVAGPQGGNNILQNYGTISSITGGSFIAIGSVVAPGYPTDYRYGIANTGSGAIGEIGGSVTVTMDGSQRSTALIFQSTTTTETRVTGGTYTIAGSPADAEYSNYVYRQDTSAPVSISGGVFTGDFRIADAPGVGPEISEGTFSADVFEYCADGFVPIMNGDGEYVVQSGFTVTFDVDGAVTSVRVPSGSPVPPESIPALPVVSGFDYVWMTDGSEWDPSSDVTDDMTVVAVPSLIVSVSIAVGEDGTTLSATPSCLAQGVQYTYLWTIDGSVIESSEGASVTASSPGVYTVTVTATADGVTGVSSASLSYRPTATGPEGEVPEFDITHDGDSAEAVTDSSTVVITSDGEHDDVSLNVTFNGGAGMVAGISISGTVSEGGVTVSVNPIGYDELSGYASGLDYVGLGGVDVSLNRGSGFDMVIRVPFSSDGTSYVGAADAYYIDDGELVSVTCRIMGEEVWIYTDHNTPYMVVVTELSQSPVYESDPTVDPEPEVPPIPFPGDDDDYVPIPPVIVQEDSGDDNTETVAACAAAAVAAAILAILLASLYRRK